MGREDNWKGYWVRLPNRRVGVAYNPETGLFRMDLRKRRETDRGSDFIEGLKTYVYAKGKAQGIEIYFTSEVIGMLRILLDIIWRQVAEGKVDEIGLKGERRKSLIQLWKGVMVDR